MPRALKPGRVLERPAYRVVRLGAAGVNLTWPTPATPSVRFARFRLGGTLGKNFQRSQNSVSVPKTLGLEDSTSAPPFRIAIRFVGIGPNRLTTVKTPQTRRQKSNVVRSSSCLAKYGCPECYRWIQTVSPGQNARRLITLGSIGTGPCR